MRKNLFISLVFIIASACTVKTFYNQLDWLIADHLESYVELSSEQQVTLYKHLDAALLWHKASQLPRYADWLQNLKRDVQTGLTNDKATRNITTFQSYLHTLLARAADEMSLLLPGLSPAQREELYASMAQKNEEFADEYIHISRQAQIETYTERMADRMEDWLGSITSQQEKLIQAGAEKIQPIAGEALKTRQRWQQALKTALEQAKDPATLRKAMHELFVNADTLRSAEHKKILQHNRQLIVQLTVDIANRMTTEQQRYLFERIDNYSKHFNELAEEARAILASR